MIFFRSVTLPISLPISRWICRRKLHAYPQSRNPRFCSRRVASRRFAASCSNGQFSLKQCSYLSGCTHCVYIYITHIHAHVHIYIHTHVHTYMYIYIYIHLHLYIQYIYIYTSTCIRIYPLTNISSIISSLQLHYINVSTQLPNQLPLFMVTGPLLWVLPRFCFPWYPV